ncbi:MAG: class E sortase, partial [Nitriliruptorales bacterium]
MPDPVQHKGSKPVRFLLDALRFRRAGRQVLTVLAVLLFLAGAGTFSYPFFTDVYTQQIIQQRLADQYGDVTHDQWRAGVQQGRPLTRIVIPSLGVDTIVVEGTSPEALRAGAGHYPNTPLPGQGGNVAIAGHRTTYGKPFNELDRLKPGDRVWLLTPIGDYEYGLSESPPGWRSNPHITNPQDWSVIEPTPQPSVTLTTCHPKGSAAQRLIARAVLVGSHPAGWF